MKRNVGQAFQPANEWSGALYESLVERLCCPIDLAPLRLESAGRSVYGHTMEGQLCCTACQVAYPIRRGVPDLVPAASIRVGGDELGRLQAATVDRFGFEWRHFRDWGWLTEYPDVPHTEDKFYGGLVEHTQAAFWSKSLFHKDDLQPGHWVLDAGCGNGRFTNQAAQSGAEVIGLDLGWGVYSAFEHMQTLPNVHIVRGDLFRLPFADRTFDRIFSIGVLMHTGNAGAAFDSIARTLRHGGLLVARVYGRGWLVYEALDALIRAVTTRMSIERQMQSAHLAAATARWLRRGKWRRQCYRGLFTLVNLLPTEHHMFDWWAAPVATHHRLPEALGWFTRNQLEIVRTDPPLGDARAERARRRQHSAITVLGRRTA